MIDELDEIKREKSNRQESASGDDTPQSFSMSYGGDDRKDSEDDDEHKNWKSSRNNDFQFDEAAASDNHDDELGDDTPAVSVNKTRNLAAIILAVIIIGYFMYKFVGGALEKRASKEPKSELQQITEPSKKDITVPSVSSADLNSGINVADKSQDFSITPPPPPPPPPPSFQPESIYTNKLEKSVNIPTIPSIVDESVSAPPVLGSGVSIPEPSSTGSSYGQNFGTLPSLSTAGQSRRQSLGGGSVVSSSPFVVENEEVRKQMLERYNAPMFLTSRADDKIIGNKATQTGIAPTENSVKKDKLTLPISLSPSTGFKLDNTYVGKLHNVILQGKVIDAVLETAINTDFPGYLRGIVSSDVFAEAGRKVLIPKGSRLIGKYDTEVKFGQGRVFVVWTRVIRPDGIDIILGGDDMVGIDLLGRTGIVGDLDNRFMDIFGSAILLTTIQVAFAELASSAVGGESTTTTSNTAVGSTSTVGDPASMAVAEAVVGLGNSFKNITEQYFSTKPRVTIKQGTHLKVYVNKDIYFTEGYDKNIISVVND